MIQEKLQELEHYVMSKIGYSCYVRLSDFTLCFAGILIGILIMALISANFIRKLYKVEDFGVKQIKMIRYNNGGKTKYMIAFNTFAETFQQVLLLAFSPFFTIKAYTYRDEKRTKRFLAFSFVLFVLILLIAIGLIVTVSKP